MRKGGGVDSVVWVGVYFMCSSTSSFSFEKTNTCNKNTDNLKHDAFISGINSIDMSGNASRMQSSPQIGRTG